jgi:hypothetical protein
MKLYDTAVVNILLNIAKRHLSSTFRFLCDFKATVDTPNELWMSMAAVGGLFSGIEGSATIAKSLYNDARRTHLEQEICRPRQRTSDHTLNGLKTYMLLTIYGLCSGDKRSYEFSEVFHSSSTEALKAHLAAKEDSSDFGNAASQELDLILEAVDVIESCHVLLLQHPAHSWPSGRRNHDRFQASHLFDPNGSSNGTLSEVASLCAYIWTASPQGQEIDECRQLWRPEFVELALERWASTARSHTDSSTLPSMLLYHLASLRLRINLGLLQKCARNAQVTYGSVTERQTSNGMHEHIDGQGFQAALWHARTMLQVIKESLDNYGRHAADTRSRDLIPEPPHLPFCIYFATVVVWYSEVSADQALSVRSNVGIENGIYLLGLLRVRVAGVLTNALRELLLGM